MAGEMIRAGYIDTEQQHLGMLGGRIITTLRDDWGIEGSGHAHAVVELPQVYARDKSKARPADLIKLATVSGAVASLYRSYEFVLPFSWKGDMPKEVVQARLHRHPSQGGLPAEAFMRMEPCPKGIRHNVYDAMGIGQWWLKRRRK
jgi:hypothetical protein